MKGLLELLIIFVAFFSVTAEEIPEYLLDMADEYGDNTRLFSINDDDVEDENGNDFFVLKFCTFQDDTHEKPFGYTLRVTVQLTDRKTQTVVFDQIEENIPQRKIGKMTYYEGHAWEYQIPFGEMKRPKLSAYAIEFGFEKDGHFVILAADYDKVDSADEILNGEGHEVKMKRTRQDIMWTY